MKKLTAISILLVLLSTAAFAQLKVGFSSRFAVDAVFFEGAYGDMAEADSTKGAFDVFASSALIGNQLRLDFTYTAENFGAYLQVKGDKLVTRGSYFFEAADGDGNHTVNFIDVLGSAFGDYKVWAKAWVFEGFAGNMDQRGRVGSNYEFSGNFGDFIDNKLEHFGVVKYSGPVGLGVWGLAPSTSGKDFLKMRGSITDTNNLNSGQYISLGVNLDSLSIPITVEVASNAAFVSLKNSMGLTGAGPAVSVSDGGRVTAGAEGYWSTDPDTGDPVWNPPVDKQNAETATSANQIAAAFRVSGGKIADFISFDAIFKVQGKDPAFRLENNGGNPAAVAPGVFDDVTKEAPLGGKWGYELGAYVGLDIFNGFKIGAGYTASFDDYEKFRVGDQEDGSIITYIPPVYNGISLNLNFSAIDSLDISLANNISFAWQQGKNKLSDDYGVGFKNGGDLIVPMGVNIPGWGASGYDPNSIYPNQNTKPGLESFLEIFNGWAPNNGNGKTVADADDPGDGNRPDSTLDSIINMKNNEQKDSWFALWNTLSVKYDITPKASVTLAVQNQLGVYEYHADKEYSYAKWTTDNFQAGLSSTFAFSPNVSFAAGLNFSVWGTTAQVTISSYEDSLTIGEVRLAIPVLFKVSF